MKNLLKNALGCLMALMIFSCDEIKDLADIDFPVTLKKTLPIEVVGTDETTTTIVLDATDDSEIRRYINNIKGYKVTKLMFAIDGYNADTEDEIYLDGMVGFSSKSANQPTVTCAVSPLNITHVAGTGDFEISTCTAVINGISSILASDDAVKIYLIGSFSDAPLSFDLTVTADVTVTANPL